MYRAAPPMRSSESRSFIAMVRQHPSSDPRHVALLRLVNTFEPLQRAIYRVLQHVNFPRERVDIRRAERLRAQGHSATIDVHELLRARNHEASHERNHEASHEPYNAHRGESVYTLQQTYLENLRDLLRSLQAALTGDGEAIEKVNEITQEAFRKGNNTARGMLQYLGLPENSAASMRLISLYTNEHLQDHSFYKALAEAIQDMLGRW